MDGDVLVVKTYRHDLQTNIFASVVCLLKSLKILILNINLSVSSV